MREIKFRAWDKRLMTGGPLGARMWFWELGKVDFDLLKAIDDSNKGHVALMQYTGLKDKNGKEIYEGDIVKDIMINGIEGLSYKVGFKDGHFTLTSITNGYDRLGIWNTHFSQEVIGNIYENKEHLEKGSGQ